jgi:hypothetical protein
MIDWLATLAAQGSRRLAPAAASIRHYLAGLHLHPDERPDLIPGLQRLADRLLIQARQGLLPEPDPSEPALP